MKNFLNGLVGFLILCIALATFQSWSLCVVTLIFSAIIYFLFFPNRYISSYSVLVGGLIALAIIDTGRLGREALVGVALYGITTVFHDLTRFTSEYGRFIVAVTLTTFLYPILMLPLGSYLVYVPQLLASVLLAGFIGFIMQQRRPTDYELV